MRVLARAVAAVLIFLAVYPFSYWLFFAQVLPPGDGDIAAEAGALATGGLAATCGWRAMGRDGRGVVATAFRWALLVGAIGFCGGFFGSMILTPEANQGPLLGIFITGPLGFLAGAIFGAVRALLRGAGHRLT
jgi:hypothetical protein